MTPLDPGLLRAICERPADTDLRLIAADWWDDHGESERAEFVRVGVALAKCFNSNPPQLLPQEFTEKGKRDHPEEYRLYCRESELLKGSKDYFLCPGHIPDWIAGIPGKVPVLDSKTLRLTTGNGDTGEGPPKEMIFRRGFVAEIHLEMQDWLTHGCSIVLAQPIERVVLTDMKPVRWLADLYWYYELPAELHPFVDHTSRGKRTEQEGIDTLSVGALAWARQEAGLPSFKQHPCT